MARLCETWRFSRIRYNKSSVRDSSLESLEANNRLRCWWSHSSVSDKIAAKIHAHARGSEETRRVRHVFSRSFCLLPKVQTASSQIARCLNVSLCHCFVLRIFEAEQSG